MTVTTTSVEKDIAKLQELADRLGFEVRRQGWRPTEYRTVDGLSVAQVIKADPDEGVEPQDVGRWRVDAPKDPENATYDSALHAQAAAETLDRIADEARA